MGEAGDIRQSQNFRAKSSKRIDAPFACQPRHKQNKIKYH
jgi:hypothetical protein